MKLINENYKLKDAGDITFYNVKQDPFAVFGLYDPKNQQTFKRLPDDIAQKTSDGVKEISKNTAGGRVRFATDSDCVAVKVKLSDVSLRPHITMLNSTGMDLYIRQNGREVFGGVFKQPLDYINEYEEIICFGNSVLREITINLPLYNNVDSIKIGLRKNSAVQKHTAYSISKPVLFYGSSITQGACASRPGLCYEAWISRRLDCDYINFGFAGSCKGEEEIVDYMSGLDISAFVCDYDHNAPNPEHLHKTHSNVYKKMRAKNYYIPIILISKPDININSPEEIKRRAIVMDTYLEGIKNGDKNLHFIDGYSLFAGSDREECTVDGCHPNDIGFYRMAGVIGKTLEMALPGRAK